MKRQSGSWDAGTQRGAKRFASNRVVMPCVLKFLTPEVLASAIIGKGGAAIAQMRERTQAKMSLTEHNELFPGTDSRVLTASASESSQLVELSRLIIDKVIEAAGEAQGDLRLSVLVPKAAVGGLIGKGGANIKQLRETSAAKISIAEAAGQGPAAEQVVSMAGTRVALEMIMEEVNKQVQTLQEENWFQDWANAKTVGPAALAKSLGAKGVGRLNHGVELLSRISEGMPHYVLEDTRGFALSCVVPNRLVGGIIGRGGSGTKEVQQLTNTKIGIRDIPGDTENRSLNIAGPLPNACAAYMLMMKRYLDSEAQAPGGYTS
mmetsp:Transcript_10358/g.24937  ORF Transcript_10358/g.24937 Transcript_10358/m.24937 type:complete len:320 (-) Transcript_10358:129-1088(-)